jgi:Arylsulfotransferase (ASST)
MKLLHNKALLILIALHIVASCSKEDENTIVLTDEIVIYNSELVYDGLVLAVENGGTSSSLVNKKGEKVYTWNFTSNLGNDLEILPNGNLLGIFKAESPSIKFGGYGGITKILSPQNDVKWEYSSVSDEYMSHHDVEMLPNGNVLIIVWEKINKDIAQLNGANVDYSIFPEKLIEVNPLTNQIVWEWRSWEHIIQDTNSSSLNFGNINERPEKININYNLIENGDIMHANGIDYDPIKDVIFISVFRFSEVWVIDHSTTTQQASNNSGGNYNKGGDLLYRFGNPSAYNNLQGERIFYNNHTPNFLKKGEKGEGNVLVYNNGTNNLQSIIYELKMPDIYNLIPNSNNEPQVIWSFTDPDLYSGKISGASRLANGNTLICEGDFGFWEVTENGEIAWKYTREDVKFWRGYGYEYNSEIIKNIILD